MRRSQFTVSLGLIIGFVFLFSCQDRVNPSDFNQDQVDETISKSVSTNSHSSSFADMGRLFHAPLYDSISYSNSLGMMSFPDSGVFVRVIADLTWKTDSFGVDTVPALFGDHFSCINLYTSIEEETDTWLEENPMSADYNDSPDGHFVQDDQIRTVLNAFGEVEVGGYVYKMWRDGLLLKLSSSNTTGLAYLRANLPDLGRLPDGVSIENQPEERDAVRSSTCKANRSTYWYPRTYWNGGKKWKIQGKTVAENYLWVHRILAKTKVFEAKKSKWKKGKQHIANSVWGDLHIKDNSCTVTPTGVSRANQVKKVHSMTAKWSGERFRFKSNVVMGRHNYPGFQTFITNIIF